MENNYRGLSNGHEWVDLGLPSGIKWATCNIGASSPEQFGDHFAWGETCPKREYSWETYKFYAGKPISWLMPKILLPSIKLSKYNWLSKNGKRDGLHILEPADDAASVLWGANWKIPKIEDFEELQDCCTIQSGKMNNSRGCTIIGPNGNSIFLPPAGVYEDDRYVTSFQGFYWSLNTDINDPTRAYYLFIDAYKDGYKGFVIREYRNHCQEGSLRCHGLSIRPVTK